MNLDFSPRATILYFHTFKATNIFPGKRLRILKLHDTDIKLNLTHAHMRFYSIVKLLCAHSKEVPSSIFVLYSNLLLLLRRW